MKRDGYVRIYRKIWDNPIVMRSPDHFIVWMYLLCSASHTGYDSVFNGERITLQKGQLVTGRKKISEDTKVDESKVQRILKLFEQEKQITQKTSNQNRLITINNWTEYQKDVEKQAFADYDSGVNKKSEKNKQQNEQPEHAEILEEQRECEQQNEQQMNNDCTTNEQQVNTYNNVNNVNNVNYNYTPLTPQGEIESEKKEKKKRERKVFVPPTPEEVQEYCDERGNGIDGEEFVAYYGSKGWMVGRNKMSNWKMAVTTWEKKRGFKYEKLSEPNKVSSKYDNYE